MFMPDLCGGYTLLRCRCTLIYNDSVGKKQNQKKKTAEKCKTVSNKVPEVFIILNISTEAEI